MTPCPECGASSRDTTTDTGPAAQVVITDPSVMDEPAAAAYLHVSVRTFKRLRESGVLPTTRIGSRVIVRRRDLDDFVDSLADERAPRRLRGVT